MQYPYLDQRTNVLVFNSSLATKFVESTTIRAISHALILQVAFSSLITDRAIEWVVGEQELHNTLTGLVGEGRIGLNPHSRLDRPRARGNWLWCSFDFDETHTAVSRDHELLMVAVPGECQKPCHLAEQ